MQVAGEDGDDAVSNIEPRKSALYQMLLEIHLGGTGLSYGMYARNVPIISQCCGA